MATTDRIDNTHRRRKPSWKPGSSRPSSAPDGGRTTNEIIDVAAQFIDRERAAGRLPEGPPLAHAVFSAVFWMVEHEMYELVRTRHTRVAEAELIETLALLWDAPAVFVWEGARVLD
jgi:hypothetical protein